MNALNHLRKCLAPLTYLVANKLTIADFAVFFQLYRNVESVKNVGMPGHVKRWYDLIEGQACVQEALQQLPAEAKQNLLKKPATSTERQSGGITFDRKQECKFVELPGAEIRKVVVRFPPEVSSYLHIGHAKAVLLNQVCKINKFYNQQQFIH